MSSKIHGFWQSLLVFFILIILSWFCSCQFIYIYVWFPLWYCPLQYISLVWVRVSEWPFNLPKYQIWQLTNKIQLSQVNIRMLLEKSIKSFCKNIFPFIPNNIGYDFYTKDLSPYLYFEKYWPISNSKEILAHSTQNVI